MVRWLQIVALVDADLGVGDVLCLVFYSLFLSNDERKLFIVCHGNGNLTKISIHFLHFLEPNRMCLFSFVKWETSRGSFVLNLLQFWSRFGLIFHVIPVVFTKTSSQINSENQKYNRPLAFVGIMIDIEIDWVGWDKNILVLNGWLNAFILVL